MLQIPPSAKVPASNLSLPVFLLAAMWSDVAGAGESRLPTLRPEDSIPHLADLKASFNSLPRKRSLVPTRDAAGNVVKIAVHEVGAGYRQRLLVFLHGVLSNHQVWRFLGGDLGRDHDLLLVDLPGCGASEKPDPAALGPSGYGPTALADRVFQALRSRISVRERPPRLALLGHSLGGTIILRMTGDPALREKYRDVYDRIDRLVLFAPFDVALEKPDPDFREVVELSDLKVRAASVAGLLKLRMVELAAQSADDPDNVPYEEAERVITVFENPKSLHAAQAMLRQAVPWTEKRRPDWPAIESLVSDYRNIDIPCLILWGARDETLPLSMGYKLRAEIPSAWLRIVPHSKHSLPVERPRISARQVRDFVAATLQVPPPIAEVPVLAERSADVGPVARKR